MTAPQPTSSGMPIPWRVKLKTRGTTWFSPGMTEAEAVAQCEHLAEVLANSVGNTAAMVAFGTRYGVLAWVRGRDVTSVEPVGPRWDGVDDNDRPPAQDPAAPVSRTHETAAHPAPAEDGVDEPDLPDEGTAWLRAVPKRKQGRRRR